LTSDQEWNPKSSAMEEQEQICQEDDQTSLIHQSKDRIIYPIVVTPSQPSLLQQEPAELTLSICSAQSST
jgi:hypothetical protein